MSTVCYNCKLLPSQEKCIQMIFVTNCNIIPTSQATYTFVYLIRVAVLDIQF